MLKNLRARLNRFTACDSGNVTVMLGLCAIPFLIGAGSAVDFGRFANTHQEVAVALDAGLLAAAATLYNDEDITEQDVTNAKAIGKSYFDSAFGTREGSDINEPTFVYNSETEIITAQVTGKVKNSFLILAGFPDLDVAVNAKAKVGHEEVIGSNVEVAMMLDVTGSMCNSLGLDNNGIEQFDQPCSSSTNLNALKVAAKDLINTVVWNDQSEYKSRVSVVPFSNRVRLGRDGESSALFNAVTGMTDTWSGFVSTPTHQTAYTGSRSCRNVSGNYWQNNKCWKNVAVQNNNLKAKPCVTERYNRSTLAFDLTEDAPGAGRYNNSSDGTRRVLSLDSSNTTYSQNGTTAALATNPDGYSATGACDSVAYGYGVAPAYVTIHDNNSIVPLTSDKTTLTGAIDGLVAQGGTAGVLGTSFAWYTISPSWADIWGQASAPESYSKLTELNESDKPKLFKFAVLMTDGLYNNALASGTSVDTSVQETNALALCAGMKAKGIEIHTVGFNLPTNSTAKTMLQSCASDTGKFTDAGNADQLKTAFDKIAKIIKSKAALEIRLTQ